MTGHGREARVEGCAVVSNAEEATQFPWEELQPLGEALGGSVSHRNAGVRFVNHGGVLCESLIGPESPSFGNESEDSDESGPNDTRNETHNDRQDDRL